MLAPTLTNEEKRSLFEKLLLFSMYRSVLHHDSDGKNSDDIEENYQKIRKLVVTEGLPDEVLSPDL